MSIIINSELKYFLWVDYPKGDLSTLFIQFWRSILADLFQEKEGCVSQNF